MGVKIYNEMDLGKVQEIKGNSGQGGDLPAPELKQEIEKLQNQLNVAVVTMTQMILAKDTENSEDAPPMPPMG